MAYGDKSITPFVGQAVMYVLSLEEYNRYGVLSASGTITSVHTPLSVDLTATFTTKGANPGQSVTLNKLSVSWGNSQGNWYDGTTFSGIPPAGSPF